MRGRGAKRGGERGNAGRTLGDDQPLEEVLDRLSRVCGATTALDRTGRGAGRPLRRWPRRRVERDRQSVFFAVRHLLAVDHAARDAAPARVSAAGVETERRTDELVDLDGVVYIGPAAVPGAAAALQKALERHELAAENRVLKAKLAEMMVGRPVLFRGVNRHDFHPETGRVLTLDDLTTEVIADGYHHAPEMLQFADRMLGVQRLCLVSDCSRALDMP